MPSEPTTMSMSACWIRSELTTGADVVSDALRVDRAEGVLEGGDHLAELAVGRELRVADGRRPAMADGEAMGDALAPGLGDGAALGLGEGLGLGPAIGLADGRGAGGCRRRPMAMPDGAMRRGRPPALADGASVGDRRRRRSWRPAGRSARS